MRGAFDEDEPEPVEGRRDTELTLGPVMLLGIFFCLALLCGLCFGLGYSMGSRGVQAAATAGQQPGAQAAPPAAGSLAKPSAAPEPIVPQQSAVATLPPSSASEAGSVSADTQNPGLTPVAEANSAQPVVKPALPAAATTPSPAPISAQPAAALRIEPATAWMVQIATVGRQEDADVLVGALRKRGYAVTLRRDGADGQFHVQVGPFSSRGDASATCRKLLNDGYNAIVQP
jgi:cell division septation protein DedD